MKRKIILFTFALIQHFTGNCGAGKNTFLIIGNSITVLVIDVEPILRQISLSRAEVKERFLRYLESISTYATPLSSFTDLLMYSIISNLFLNCSV